MELVKNKLEEIEKIKTLLANASIEPEEVNAYLASLDSTALPQRQKVSQLLLRPEVALAGLIKELPKLNILSKFQPQSLEQAEIQLKYEVYLNKESELATKMNALENHTIPDNFNYDKILSLSNEARQKFNKIKPQTLGQAGRISGVNPSDVQILMVYMGR